MTLAEFKKLTNGLPDHTRIVITGTSLSDAEQQYDVSELRVAPLWKCGDLVQNALLVRTVRCDPRFAALVRLGDTPAAPDSDK